jgi:hypothetical protein
MPEIITLEQALAGEDQLVYARNLALPNSYIHELLFTPLETDELTVDVIKNQSNLPVMAQIAELGTEATYGSREGMSGQRIEIPKIQRGRLMEEKLVRLALTSGLRRDEFERLRREQLNDTQYCVDAIRARKEWIAVQAATTGAVSYTEGNVQISVDYGMTAEQKPVLSGTDLWSDTANSTPILDIQGWVDERAQRGTIITRALTSRKVLGYLLQNLSIRKSYFGDPSGSANPPQLNQQQLNALFESLGLPRIVSYDTQARVEQRSLDANRQVQFSTVRMAPQNRFVLMPEEPLGNYLWARTTEELMSEIEAEATGDMGIYVFKQVKEHPIQISTIGVNLAFPAFPNADQVVTAQVIA